MQIEHKVHQWSYVGELTLNSFSNPFQAACTHLCKGVPVKAHLKFPLRERTAIDVLVILFLMICASVDFT